MDLQETFGSEHPVVGMVHLPPLPGAPGYDSNRTAVRERMLEDANALVTGGVDGIVLENFGDAPFYPDNVPKHVVAAMSSLATTLTDTVEVPVGVNVLRNDAEAAMAVAAAARGAFVRVNVHVGATVTDQGLLEGRAHETLRLRDRIDASVAVLADVHVKHGTPLGTPAIEVATREAIDRGGADGIVVSGTATGTATDTDAIATVAKTTSDRSTPKPVFVGSGVTPTTVEEYVGAGADGVIVGTALKEAGRTENPVSTDRVRRLVEAFDAARSG